MDYKKDIEQRGLLSQQGAGGMEAFTVSLSKKCERLATAVYLVTNFLSDTEPLKFRLRTLSLEFVRDAAFARTGGHMTETHNLSVLQGNILETLALLELAFISGHLSEMNFTVLKREYATLRDAIEIKKSSRESRTDSVLGETFFGSSFHTGELANKDIFSKGHSNTQMSFTMSERNQTVREKETKPQSQKIESVKPKTLAPVVTNKEVNIDREARRTRILKLVKDNREIMIKDIAIHFADLSEKTLQRELVALVESGVLKKTGERRWSRYSLA